MTITTEKLCKFLGPELFITAVPKDMQECMEDPNEEVTDDCCQTICQYEDNGQSKKSIPLHQLKKPELIEFIFQKSQGKVTRTALRKKKKEELVQDATKL